MPINAERINDQIMTLSKFGETKEGGVTRVSLDQNYMKALEHLSSLMKAADLDVSFDDVGNLIGRKDRCFTNTAPIILGSHIDTVINGGKYDGTVGVMGGLEVIRALDENGLKLSHPIELIAFLEEEGTRWGLPLLGSKVFAGEFKIEDVLQVEDREGISVEEALKILFFHHQPINRAERYPHGIHSYLELHIEQGAVLDSLGLPVGIVTGIAGPLFMTIRLQGRADHAGATPMHLRKDALIGAARLVVEAKAIAEETSDTAVATVGRLEVKPGAVNVVPGEVLMSYDLRDIQLEKRNRMEELVKASIQKISDEQNLKFEVLNVSSVSPVAIKNKMIEIIETACLKVGSAFLRLPSGAGHDAQAMASITEVGMIFIRSRDGISHSPSEFTTREDIDLGVKVLYETVLMLDAI